MVNRPSSAKQSSKPSTLNPQPSTLNTQHLTLNTKTLTLNAKTSTLPSHSQFLSHFRKRFNGFIQVFFLVGGGDLYSDSCLFFGYNRIEEANHINSFF